MNGEAQGEFVSIVSCLNNELRERELLLESFCLNVGAQETKEPS